MASTPGLYGGTLNYHECDAEKLIRFLEQNPGKAAAWARALGIQPSQIRNYVNGLTPVTLRTDTRVTNHGYVNGYANPFQAVLEAGTAVLVDKYGEPVVKCYCGNPLTPPELLSRPTYTGDLWPDFRDTDITIIHVSVTIIDVFIIYDFRTGKFFKRTRGVRGRDLPYSKPRPRTRAPSVGSTPPPQATPSPAQPTPPSGETGSGGSNTGGGTTGGSNTGGGTTGGGTTP